MWAAYFILKCENSKITGWNRVECMLSCEWKKMMFMYVENYNIKFFVLQK